MFGKRRKGSTDPRLRSLLQKAATWGWDKTCMLAGAFLATTGEIPDVSQVPSERNAVFPYWVALDKHTPQGREVLRRVSLRTGIKYRQLLWTSFYFESAVANAMLASPWFKAEREWRLRRAGLTLQAARQLWDEARPLVRAEHSEGEARLRDTLARVPSSSAGLFDSARCASESDG